MCDTVSNLVHDLLSLVQAIVVTDESQLIEIVAGNFNKECNFQDVIYVCTLCELDDIKKMKDVITVAK